jgi:hypothetical protein
MDLHISTSRYTVLNVTPNALEQFREATNFGKIEVGVMNTNVGQKIKKHQISMLIWQCCTFALGFIFSMDVLPSPRAVFPKIIDAFGPISIEVTRSSVDKADTSFHKSGAGNPVAIADAITDINNALSQSQSTVANVRTDVLWIQLALGETCWNLQMPECAYRSYIFARGMPEATADVQRTIDSLDSDLRKSLQSYYASAMKKAEASHDIAGGQCLTLKEAALKSAELTMLGSHEIECASPDLEHEPELPLADLKGAKDFTTFYSSARASMQTGQWKTAWAKLTIANLVAQSEVREFQVDRAVLINHLAVAQYNEACLGMVRIRSELANLRSVDTDAKTRISAEIVAIQNEFQSSRNLMPTPESQLGIASALSNLAYLSGWSATMGMFYPDNFQVAITAYKEYLAEDPNSADRNNVLAAIKQLADKDANYRSGQWVADAAAWAMAADVLRWAGDLRKTMDAELSSFEQSTAASMFSPSSGGIEVASWGGGSPDSAAVFVPGANGGFNLATTADSGFGPQALLTFSASSGANSRTHGMEYVNIWLSQSETTSQIHSDLEPWPVPNISSLGREPASAPELPQGIKDVSGIRFSKFDKQEMAKVVEMQNDGNILQTVFKLIPAIETLAGLSPPELEETVRTQNWDDIANGAKTMGTTLRCGVIVPELIYWQMQRQHQPDRPPAPDAAKTFINDLYLIYSKGCSL